MDHHGPTERLPSICNALAKRVTSVDPREDTLRSRARAGALVPDITAQRP
jgi:hypothetical protein